jgi:hypothetical protein
MTLKELRQLLATEPLENDNLEIKVWLPGSTISLRGATMIHRGKTLMIEGNVDPGSALALTLP